MNEPISRATTWTNEKIDHSRHLDGYLRVEACMDEEWATQSRSTAEFCMVLVLLESHRIKTTFRAKSQRLCRPCILLSERGKKVRKFEIPFSLKYQLSSIYQQDCVTCRSKIRFLSNLTVNTSRELSLRQITLLDRGLMYVSSCQMRSLLWSSFKDNLSKKFVPVHRQLNKLFSQVRVHLDRSINFRLNAQTPLNNLFSTPLTHSLSH